MGSRQYGQACSLAYALDRIGERWTLLIVRELSLGPMRFSALVRAVGGAPTDILTKRLRELEQHGVIARRELEPPASATVYELTELGRGLERPMVELGRWGMGLQELEDVIDLAPSSLPSAIRVILQPPPDFEATLGLRTDGEDYWLRIEDGWTTIGRGAAPDADLFLAGSPLEVVALLVVGEPGIGNVEVEGDRDLLERLRTMVVIPDRMREEAEAAVPSLAAAALG
jgi:DNA-binding HxlR family transcriptional regulator